MKVFLNNDQLDPDVADALYELSNVGIGKATNALGKMISERITIQTPKITPTKTDVTKLIEQYKGKLAMGVLMRLAENLSGAVLIVVEREFMTELVNRLTGGSYSEEQLLSDEDCRSVVQEVTNIMAASYMSAIGAYTGLRIFLTPVMVGVEKLEDLIAYPVEKMSLDPKNCICIDTRFMVQDSHDIPHTSEGNIIVFPDDASINTLMKALMG